MSWARHHHVTIAVDEGDRARKQLSQLFCLFRSHAWRSKKDLAMALHFVEEFFEARAWNVVLLTEEKRTVLSQQQCSQQQLKQNLRPWLGTQAVHVSIQPVLLILVMVDLDE